MVANREMIYNAGGCWVLEQKVGSIYLRMDDCSFAAGKISLHAINDGEEDTVSSYWEVGAKTTDIPTWIVREMIDADLLMVYMQMKADWLADSKRLYYTPVVTSEADRIKLFKQHMDKLKATVIDGYEWIELAWTIGFAGVTINVKNCASIYNAIEQFITEEGL